MLKTTVLPSGHTDALLCCVVHEVKKLVLSGGEDASICFTDPSSKQPISKFTQKEGDVVASIVCSPADEHTVFASAGQHVLHLDLRRSLGEESVIDTFRINQEEINNLSIDTNGHWIAAADDSGEVQVISVGNGSGSAQSPSTTRTYKTLRRGHSNICSSVSFRPNRSTELVTGGLDCRMVRWDFTKLCQLHVWDMSGDTLTSNGQIFNPPMVNGVATPTMSELPYSRLVAAARGDGCIALYDGDTRPSATAGGRSRHAINSRSSRKATATSGREVDTGIRWLSGPDQGGHRAAANSVCFTPDSGGKSLYSVGNDKKICLWSWEVSAEPVMEVKHSSKINWVCPGGGVGGIDAMIGDVRGRLVGVYRG